MKHYNVVAAVIYHNDQFLCMQKGKTKFDYTSYKFEFPGGKIEIGETPQEALRRELLEEMNCPIDVGREVTIVYHIYPDFSIHLTAFLCEAIDATNFKMNEHMGYKWCSKDQLIDLDWVAADIDIVKTLINETFN